MSKIEMTPQDVYVSFQTLLRVNTEESYKRIADENGRMFLEHALNGTMAMLDFGLFLASNNPTLAATLRQAIAEIEAEGDAEVSTETAVNAVVAL